MKKFLDRIFPPSGYGNPLLSYPALLLVMLAGMAYVVYHTIALPPGMDARSYLAAVDNIAAGQLDYLRTPVYPAMLLILRSIFGVAHLTAANCVVQCAAILVSVHFFRRLAFHYIGSRKAAFWVTAVFYLLPFSYFWIGMYMTETWAVTGMIMLLWWSTRDLPGAITVRSAVMAGLWLAFLVFLRPIFVCLLPVLTLFWLVRLRYCTRRGGIVAMLCMVALTGIGAACYATAMHARFGIHSFSGINIPNNYCMVSESCLIRPDHTDNPALADTIAAIYAEADTVVYSPVMLCVHSEPYPCEEFTAAEIEEAINHAIAENPGGVVLHQLRKLQWQVSLEPMLDYTRLPRFASIERVIVPPMPFYLLFLALLPVWLIRLWRRGNRAPMTWLMWLICVVMSVSSILGAMSDYARLVLPVMPAAFIMIAKTLMPLRYCPGLEKEYQ